VFAAWTLLVWATRLDNIWSDDALTTGDKVSRTLLALSFVAVAGLVITVAVRTFRRPPDVVDVRLVQVAAGWTIGVWVVRAVGIALADHEVAFVVVHVVLGVVSAALAVVAVRAVLASRPVVDDRTATVSR
jgi:hypothetical protein